MTWSGYFEFDGNEVVNTDRTEAYAADEPWFKPVYKNGNLAQMLGQGVRYTSPLLDDAPWVDPLYLESLDFYGYYPLSVTGLEDSTRVSTPVESLNDGGTPGRIRHASRQVVFSGLILAGSDAAADYGVRWLREALVGGACGAKVTDTGIGGEMCYLSAAPEMEVAEGGALVLDAILDGGYFAPDGSITDTSLDGGTASTGTYPEDFDGGGPGSAPTEGVDGGTAGTTGSSTHHEMRSVQTDDPALDGGGPASLGDTSFDGGGPARVVSTVTDSVFPFSQILNPGQQDNTAECLTPYRRSLRRVLVNSGPIVTGKAAMKNGGQAWTVDFTAVAGVPHEIGAEVPVVVGLLDPQVAVPWAGGVVPDAASIDLDGFIYPEGDCVVQVSEPLYDPLWPLASPPPGPPNVPLGNYVPPINWRRRQFTIPKSYVPAWGEVVPKLQVHARGTDLRTLRLRFYSDPFLVGDISDDPCAYCGDIVISYVPVDHTLVLDGAEERVYVITPGGAERSADSLVFGTDGRPFEWPALSCGFGYIVTVDLPQTQAAPVVDLSLYPRAAA